MLRVPEIRFGLSERASAGSSGGPLVYWLFRHLLGLAVLRCRAEAANEVEILVWSILQQAGIEPAPRRLHAAARSSGSLARGRCHC